MVCCASLISLKMYVCALTKNFFNKHLKIVTIFSSTDVICTLNYLLGGGRIWCMASPCAVVVTGFVQKLKIICQPSLITQPTIPPHDRHTKSSQKKIGIVTCSVITIHTLHNMTVYTKP